MFFSLQQSAFLHALGSAIGNSLWQLAAIWLVFAAISGVTKMNPANRYRLAVFFSTAGFVWFLYSLVAKYIHIASSPVEVWDTYQNIGTPIIAYGFSNNISFVYHSFLASLSSLSPYISCAYLLVWLLLATRLVNGFRQVRQFGTQGLGKVNIDLRLFVQKHSSLLQIQKKVRIFTSAYVQSPITIGFFKPLILLPIASMSHLSAAQVEAILLHELAHIKRHDYLVNIFVQVAEITLFFNPFMRLLLKQIKQERENCCDDYVLQFEYNAADYAKALLGIAQNKTATLLAMGAKNNQFQLLNRVKRMVAPQPQTFNYRQQLYMLCLITILGLGITMVVPNSSAQIKKENIVTKVVAQPIIDKKLVVADNEDEDISETPIPPKSYDFVKSMQHMANNILAKDIDLQEIENTGKEIEAHSKENEQQAKQIAEKALKDAQPEIEKATVFAKKLAENIANSDKQKFLKDGNIDAYVSSVLGDVNETIKQISFQHLVAPRPPACPEAPVAPVAPLPNIKFRPMKQALPERKILISKEQLEDQQENTRKSMDSLQSAMAELGNKKQQEALNKVQAKLAAIKSKDYWDVAFNEPETSTKVTSQFTVTYANKMNKIIKKFVNGLTADINIKDLNDIEIQLKSDIDKIQQSDRINIQITTDRHQDKMRRRNTDANAAVVVDNGDAGSK